MSALFFFQAEDGIRDLVRSRGLGDVYKRQAQDVGVGLVIPCHYDMFEFNTATPDDFIVTCESLGQPYRCLLYTSDAADERSSVDLGGRRIIQKKKQQQQQQL